MEFLTIEMIEKFLSVKDIMTAGAIFFLINKKIGPTINDFKTQVLSHMGRVEAELGSMSKKIGTLSDSIVDLEIKQTERINNLSERVHRLEKNKE